MFFSEKSNKHDESSLDDADWAELKSLNEQTQRLTKDYKKIEMQRAFFDYDVIKLTGYYAENKVDKARELLKNSAQNATHIQKITNILNIDKKYLAPPHINIQNFIRDVISHDNELSTIYNSDPSLTSTTTTFKP